MTNDELRTTYDRMLGFIRPMLMSFTTMAVGLRVDWDWLFYFGFAVFVAAFLAANYLRVRINRAVRR